MLDFVSHVNIMTCNTWEQLGRPRLYESGIHLKLADQGLIEPIIVWRNVDTTIKGISTKVKFEIIDPKCYTAEWHLSVRVLISLMSAHKRTLMD